MKTLRAVTVPFILIYVCTHAYGQLWKQYADSAKAYSNQKRYDSSIQLYIKARDELKKDSLETNSYTGICDSLANLYEKRSQYQKAEPLYLEAKQIREKMLGKEHPDYAESCNNLGRLHLRMGQHQKAEKFFSEARQIREKVLGKENPGYAAVCNNLATVYRETGQYEKAESLYLEAKQIREKVQGKQNIDYAAVCTNLGTLYRQTGQYEKAEFLYLEAKQIREKVQGREHPGYAVVCNNLAALYVDMGQYQKAGNFFLEAKQILENTLGKEHADYATSCNNLAALYVGMGQYQKAEPLYSESKQIREKVLGKDNHYYAASCDNLANLYHETGHYEKAEPLYLEARQIFEKALGKEHPDYAAVCNNLAALYSHLGQYEKAESFHLESKQIKEKILGKDHPGYAINCNNLGSLYHEMGEYKKAESLFLEAKQILENAFGKEHPDYALSCNDLANLYVDMKQYEKAEFLYLEATQIRGRVVGKEHPEYAASCNTLANFYMNKGQYERAEALYLEAKQIRERALGKEHSEYAASCIDLGNLYWKIKKPDKAVSFYEEAFQSQNIQIKKLFQFTSEAEKESYLKTIADFEDYFLSFTSVYAHFNQGLSYDVSLSNRNLILSSLLQLRQNIYNTSDTSIKNKYDAWMNAREQLSFWYTKPTTDRPDYVKDLEEQANTLEKELTRLSSVFKKEQAVKEITWKNIQQNLKPNEAAIEFVKFNFYNGKRFTDSTYYMALLLTKDKKEPKLIPLFESGQLNNLLRVSNTVQTINPLYSRNKGVNTAYNLIWEPLEKHLNGIKKIYFAPAGLLFRISFAALPVNDYQLLSDKFQLVQLNGTASVVNESGNFIDTSAKIYVYGAIKYDTDSAGLKQVVAAYRGNDDNEEDDDDIHFLPDDGTRGDLLKYLEGTEHEINEIDSLGKEKNYSIVLLSGDTATEESIKALKGAFSPSVLHIATHGFFFPDPKEKKGGTRSSISSGSPFRQSDNPLFRSGLFFAGASNAWKGKPVKGVEDGILTSYEVSNFYLPNTKLVVLSACKTGLGEIQGNEGVYGLQRAFKTAGAENLIMSLWKVPDTETAEFMQEFYKNIFDKKSISDAFYNAQTVMKHKYRNEPFKWAAWILVR